jgi:hypothetical protein
VFEVMRDILLLVAAFYAAGAIVTLTFMLFIGGPPRSFDDVVTLAACSALWPLLWLAALAMGRHG